MNDGKDIVAETRHFKPDDSWHGSIRKGGAFGPEKGRYHLIIGLFCPFAHRVNLVRHVKSLTSVLDLSVVKPYPKGDDTGWPGWRYVHGENDDYPEATKDVLFGHEYLHQLYFKTDPNYKGRYSVPVIWDKKLSTIVSNESAEMLRWLPNAFDPVLGPSVQAVDLYPEDSQVQIDDVSDWMQRDLNTGVYKAGFAKTEDVYTRHVPAVFAALNKVESMLAKSGGPFLLGKTLTELDLRCYATVVRFDPVYVQHFKCNLGMIRSHYPLINNWLKNLYFNIPGFRETTNFEHIKDNYTKSHADINPFEITPLGPIPHIEEGVMTEFSKIQAGGVSLEVVKSLETRL